MVELPDDVTRQFGPLTLDESFRRDDDGTVHAIFELHTGPSIYTAEQVGDFRKAYLEYAEEDAVQILFEHLGERQLALGDVGAALETFHGLLRDEPGEAIHHTRIARALLTAGLGGEARLHARIAAERAPQTVESHKTLGLVLAHDELGRKFHAGFDRDGAERSFRRALALQSEDVETRGELAILLEHDLQGVRYGPTADLDGAIREYRELGGALASLSLENNLRVALMEAERFEELLEYTRDSAGPRPETVHHIIAVAATRGADEAIRTASRRTASADQYRRLLVSAAELLPRIRRYPVAGELLAAGARGETQSVSLLPRIDMLRRSVRHETLDSAPASPEGLLRAFLIDLLDTGDVASHLHPLVADVVASNDSAFDEALDALREGLVSNGTPVNVTLDIALSNGEILREGSREDGFRLRYRLVLPDQEPAELQMFVAHDGTRYRLVDFGRPTLAGPRLVLVDWSEMLDQPKVAAGAEVAVAMARENEPFDVFNVFFGDEDGEIYRIYHACETQPAFAREAS